VGTSDPYLGSGGAWNGIARHVKEFHEDATEDAAESIVEQTLIQLALETAEATEAPALTDLIDPTRPALPGLRIRATGGGSGEGPGSGGSTGGATAATGSRGGGRSRARIATSGARALAAGSALRRGDGAQLQQLGLNLAELDGLDVLDQIARILDVAAPASGLQADAELRHALTDALLAVLDDEGSSRTAMEAFIASYTFEVLITEVGARERDGERAGALTGGDERQLRKAIEAYVRQLDLSDDLVTEHDRDGPQPGRETRGMSAHALITTTAARTPTLSTGEFLWRPLGKGLDSSFHTTLSPRAPELGAVPAMNADLISLAILTYLADRTAPRPRGRELGTRELELSVPVSDPEPWTAIAPALEDLLRFLSGDEWRLTFKASRARTNKAASVHKPSAAVCLLSGGADSLAGALLTREDNVVPALVSHWDWTIISAFQSELVGRLEAMWGVKIDHISQRIGRRKRQLESDDAFPEEGSSRSRSFLFIALGLAAAAIRGTDLVMAENGWASINPPLAGERRGSFSTRTTNPAFLDGLQQVLAEVEISTQIHNPFEGLTKGDVFAKVRDLLGATEASSLLSASHSCAKPIAGRFHTPIRTHCGMCFGCLLRRAAFIAAGLEDHTAYIDEVLSGAKRADYLSPNQRRLYETVNYAASKGVSAGDIIELGLPGRMRTRDALTLAQRGLDELAQVKIT
jgi:7-cyano-7-deazaguanine synthase in queuosine biosynthesis